MSTRLLLIPLLFVAAACSWLGAASASADLVLQVSPSGSDSAEGSVGSPLLTLNKALALAGDGPAVIRLTAGDYPAISDKKMRTGLVSVEGDADPAPAQVASKRLIRTRIAGGDLLGSTKLHFAGVHFTERVSIRRNPATSVPASDLAFDNVEMSNGCLNAREFEGLVVTSSWLHDCATGIGGPPANVSSGVNISRNYIEGMTGDGIIFGHWHDVDIARNVITDLRRGAGNTSIHNDGIQTYGDVDGLRIASNLISESSGQLILLKVEDGPISNAVVENNVLYGSDAYAIQNAGAAARYVNNTVWDSGFGGLLVRAGPRVTVANNILAGLTQLDGSDVVVRRNAIQKNCLPAPEVVCLTTPPFVAAAVHDFRLPLGSPLGRAGDAAYSPPVDFFDIARPSPPSLGAIEPVSAPIPLVPDALPDDDIGPVDPAAFTDPFDTDADAVAALLAFLGWSVSAMTDGTAFPELDLIVLRPPTPPAQLRETLRRGLRVEVLCFSACSGEVRVVATPRLRSRTDIGKRRLGGASFSSPGQAGMLVRVPIRSRYGKLLRGEGAFSLDAAVAGAYNVARVPVR